MSSGTNLQVYYFEIADKVIELRTNVSINPYKYFVRVPIYLINHLRALQIELVCSDIEFVNLEDNRLIFHSNQISGHLLRKLVLYWAGLHNESYRAIHGAGIVFTSYTDAQKIGILIVGRHGAGKSTVAKKFASIGTISFLDDDLLLVGTDNMMVGGKMGSITTLENGQKKLRYIPNGILSFSIDLVLLLDKRIPGGKYKWIGYSEVNLIEGEYVVLDGLPRILQKEFLDKFPKLVVTAPVCLIGTMGKENILTRILKSIIQEFIKLDS